MAGATTNVGSSHQIKSSGIPTNYGALSTLVTVFFFWGFIAAGNSVFIPFCKHYFNLDQFQSQLIDFAFYLYIGLFVIGFCTNDYVAFCGTNYCRSFWSEHYNCFGLHCRCEYARKPGEKFWDDWRGIRTRIHHRACDWRIARTIWFEGSVLCRCGVVFVELFIRLFYFTRIADEKEQKGIRYQKSQSDWCFCES